MIAAAGGCDFAGIYAPQVIENAQNVLVLPGAGAPGIDGPGAGRAESGLLITSLADLQYFKSVEGPVRMRKALAGRQDALWDGAVQAEVSKTLGIDLLALCEVTDYRFTKEFHKSNYVVGSGYATETEHIVAVSVRFISPADGRLVFCGSGLGKSKEGFGPAMVSATEMALKELKAFLDQMKQKHKQTLAKGS